MTKFKIFAPSGIEVCTIEAVSKISTATETSFYDYQANLVFHEKALCEIPGGWFAIPEEIIIKNENMEIEKMPSLNEAADDARKYFGWSK